MLNLQLNTLREMENKIQKTYAIPQDLTDIIELSWELNQKLTALYKKEKRRMKDDDIEDEEVKKAIEPIETAIWATSDLIEEVSNYTSSQMGNLVLNDLLNAI